VTGAPPSGTTSFSYAVTATNVAGHATAGPFTVTVTKPSPNADVSAVLSCPASLTVGGTGTCTLAVANAGPATASKVIAAITLPPALSETSCSPGCAQHATLYTWTLSSLADGASAKLSIAVKASRTGTATVLATVVSQNPDPDPRNNISTQQITIKR
jgi:large repetitive protein